MNPKYSLEGLMLKLKVQYFGHLMRRTNSLEKTLMLGKIEGRRRRGRQRMRWLDGISDSMYMSLSKLWEMVKQGSLACCSPRGHKELALLIKWPKYWSFSFSIRSSNEYSGLISFRMDWLDLLAIQQTLKRLLQLHSLKASILWHSAFFIVHLSHPYMTTGKTIALIIWTFVGKVISLLLIYCLDLSKLYFQRVSIF